jgi:myosin heavy subunit
MESISAYLEKDKEDLAPHLFHIGKLAYQSMRSFGRSQAVIISGESGAGKY